MKYRSVTGNLYCLLKALPYARETDKENGPINVLFSERKIIFICIANEIKKTASFVSCDGNDFIKKS